MAEDFVIENGLVLSKDRTCVIRCADENIENLVLPPQIRAIEPYAFCHAHKLKTVLWGNSVEEIGAFAFAHTALRECELPPSVKTVGEGAFFGCAELSLTVYDKEKLDPGKMAYGAVTQTGRQACYRHRITVKRADGSSYTVYMGKRRGTVEPYREAVRFGWENFPEFDFARLDEAFPYLRELDEKDEVAALRLKNPIDLSDEARERYEERFSARKRKKKPDWKENKKDPSLLRRYEGTASEVVFPTELYGEKIMGIGNSTQKSPENYQNITSVVLPEGYEFLGNYAFSGCLRLKSVKLPSTLRYIGKGCFQGCQALETVEIPPSVRYIGDHAFEGSGVKCFEFFGDVAIGDFGLGQAEKLIARGRETGNSTKDHLIGTNLKEVYTNGTVDGITVAPKPIEEEK